MGSAQTAVRDRSWRTAIFGMLVLTLGIGIGRFLYTSLLPIMLDEGLFSFGQLSWAASANYAGYLIGSLLFSFGAFHRAIPPRVMLLLMAIATGVLILAMALFTSLPVIIVVRFLAGIASAGMMIFGSMLVLQHTHRPAVIASLFAGVGLGIVIGNEYVNLGLRFALTSSTLWLGAAIMAGAMLALLFLLSPPRAGALAAAAGTLAARQMMPWWLLALIYGLAGFGYIIVATYLPLMAKDAGMPLLTQHLWSLVGLSIIPGCYGWLWAARRWGIMPCLSANLLIQSGCVVLTLFSASPLLLILSSAGFGATFMGTTSLVMPLAKQLHAPSHINLLGLVTLTYGIGQIVGPLLTSALSRGTGDVTQATLCGAVALFLAAGFCLRQVCTTTAFSREP